MLAPITGVIPVSLFFLKKYFKVHVNFCQKQAEMLEDKTKPKNTKGASEEGFRKQLKSSYETWP